MDLLVSGGSGLIGTALCGVLENEGHRAILLTRSPSQRSGEAVGWDPSKGEIDAASIEAVDAVVHLAGVEQPPKVLLSGSAAGYLRQPGDEILT